MNKLITISVFLLSLNLYGVELNFSRTGLEGWGKKEGVYIGVEDYSHRDKTFDAKAIKNQIELKLRLAGIKVHNRLAGQDKLYINMQPLGPRGILTGYAMTIIPQRTMTFKYNGKEYIAVSSSNELYGGLTGINYRPQIEEKMDELLLNYLKANPKKEEK